MTKRIISLTLVLMMVLFAVACGADDAKKPAETTPKAGETTAAPDTTVPAVTEPEYKPELPEVRFEGEQLVIVHRDPQANTYKEYYLMAEEITGDLLNDGQYHAAGAAPTGPKI